MLPLLILAFFAQRIRSFHCHQTASVSIAFAVWLLPILTAAALAVDYSTVSNTRTSLNAAMDAAALAGVSTTTVHSLSGRADIREAIEDIAEADFHSQIAGRRTAKASMKSATVKTTIADGVVTTRVCYSAEVATSFMHAFGVAAVHMANCAEARASIPTFYSIHAIVDASGSMGIGASIVDQEMMQNRLGCAFACHTINWSQPTHAPRCDTRGWHSQTPNCAQRIGAKTRFDVVREVLVEMVDKAAALNRMSGQFTFSVHKFSTRPTEVQPTTADLSRVKSSITNMTMDQAGAGTNLRHALDEIARNIPSGGDGTSASSPKVFVLILTDGVEGNVDEQCTIRVGQTTCNYWGFWTGDTRLTLNHPGFWEGGERSQVIDPAVCNPLKSKGATVMTLHTEYLTPPGSTDNRFRKIQSILVPEIKKRLEACATHPDLAFSATTPAHIQAAMGKIFQTITIRPQISM